MTPLAEQSIRGYTPNSRALSNSDALQLLPGLDGWKLTPPGDPPCDNRRLYKNYRFDNFASALAFTNRVAELAEQANHHPRICIEWGAVSIHWWTHEVSGLFINDFIMAARCEQACL
ncbi:Pterin-4-alpha-carbinolamine dehydratase [hydrothermal vent metagenome]|uniref:4a-hydroxytetrahydrobiopterin dehydratase n=1 Tax=hydrothermal vent metagenome TaxID=652676 RepID=A0A3B0XIM0_9ZZZZ